MPNAAPHLCLGMCGARLPPGQSRCPACRVTVLQAQDARRGTAAKRGYSYRHQVWRAAVLARDPLCRGCGGRPAVVADHLVALKRGGAPLDLSNGQGLCWACHTRKTRAGQ